MDVKDLLEFLVTDRVFTLAGRLRVNALEEEEQRTGQRIDIKSWRPVDDFVEQAVKTLVDRNARVMTLLKP